MREEAPPPAESPPELPVRPPPEPAGDQVVISRVIRATEGQMVEIPFRGTGWVYLGELGNRRGISYNSRRLDVERGVTTGQSFVFLAEAPGTYILRFYRQDFIQDLITNEYVQVIVGERSENSVTVPLGRVIADPPGVVPVPAQETDSTEEEEAPPDAPPAVESPEAYARRAAGEFDAGRVEAALDILEDMIRQYPSGTDEAWWLYGQLLEANSPSRDIRRALEYYRRLVREYPQSGRVQEAQRRITYLERYYFNIR